ncbi:MAG: type II toxin-antitoxin system death-on-curing family toxin [Verrucomicrobiales bacterium]
MVDSPKEPVWVLTESTLAFHQRQMAEHGGEPGLRDEALLESALARPLQLWNYGDPLPDLCALAAAYAFGVAKNHPFFDGNKRTAYVVYRTFLVRNGLEIKAAREEKYLKMLALASGDETEESFASWLRQNTAPAQP